MNTELPRGAVHYATSRFTLDSLPDNLRKDHSTKAGVWGQLANQSRQLWMSRAGKEDLLLCASETAVFVSQETHSVAATGEVEFELRFFREETPDAK